MDESLEDSFLVDEEKLSLAALKHPRRRLEWLGARVALKKLLLRSHLIRSPFDCRVKKDHKGRPIIEIWKGSEFQELNCSISHKDGIAAVCLAPGFKVGIDIEVISERPWRLRRAFASEGDLVSDRFERATLYSLIWACKEAASKVLGLGIAAGFKKLAVKADESNLFSVEGDGFDPIGGIFYFFKNYIIAIGWSWL